MNLYNAENQSYTTAEVSNDNTIKHYLSLCGMTGGELLSMSKYILEFIGGPSINKEVELISDNAVCDSVCIMSELQLHNADLRDTKQILLKIAELLGMDK